MRIALMSEERGCALPVQPGEAAWAAKKGNEFEYKIAEAQKTLKTTKISYRSPKI